MDAYGRLHIVSSTQIVFHVRRILSRALGIPKSRIRVEKPRIGGGFGAKQTSVSEVYPAFVTLKTGRPLQADLHPGGIPDCRQPPPRDGNSRASGRRQGWPHPGHRPVHPVQLGAPTASTGPTTVACRATRSIPLYTGNLEAYRFSYDVCVHQCPGGRRLPRVRRHPGHLCGGDHRQRAGRAAGH